MSEDCDECKFVEDYSYGELVCKACGLMIDEEEYEKSTSASGKPQTEPEQEGELGFGNFM